MTARTQGHSFPVNALRPNRGPRSAIRRELISHTRRAFAHGRAWARPLPWPLATARLRPAPCSVFRTLRTRRRVTAARPAPSAPESKPVIGAGLALFGRMSSAPIRRVLGLYRMDSGSGIGSTGGSAEFGLQPPSSAPPASHTTRWRTSATVYCQLPAVTVPATRSRAYCY